MKYRQRGAPKSASQTKRASIARLRDQQGTPIVHFNQHAFPHSPAPPANRRVPSCAQAECISCRMVCPTTSASVMPWADFHDWDYMHIGTQSSCQLNPDRDRNEPGNNPVIEKRERKRSDLPAVKICPDIENGGLGPRQYFRNV